MSVATLEPPQSASRNESGRPKRLLLVAYNFPPVGGAGVQRPVKWAKYLGRFGWDVTVLTTLNPSVPARDESLLADLPADVDIVRARTWEPNYRVKQTLIRDSSTTPGLWQRLRGAARNVARRCIKLALQPDPQVLWNYHAIRTGANALRERPHDAILVTAPAYSSFYIGAALKRRFNLPLVLDYRDEWDLSGKYLENAQRDWFSRVVQSRMQKTLLRRADAVIATTPGSSHALAEKLRDLRHLIPSHCIYNGFDTEDFSDNHQTELTANSSGCDVMQPESGTFRLVYTGTLWNLTDISPLVRGIERLDATHPELTRRLELVCVGRKTPEQVAILNRLQNTSVHLVPIDYCDHAQALQWLRSASGLCLLLSDVPGADRVVPAKLFEYLAIRKEMLSIGPAGETADIVRRFFPQGHFRPDQVQPISDWLQSRLKNVQSHSTTTRMDEQGLREFSRESQTERLAEILNTLVHKT